MGEIFVTTYEVNASGMEIMQAHIAKVADYHARGFAVSNQFEAMGFRPRRHSSPGTLMFKADSAPPGFKLVKRERDGVIECSPRMTSARGKEAKAALESIGAQPSGDDLAREFGWSPSMFAIDTQTGTIYFPTTMSVEKPTARHFLRLPRFADDNWTQHPGLTAIAESEFMRAIEDHNAAVREIKALAA